MVMVMAVVVVMVMVLVLGVSVGVGHKAHLTGLCNSRMRLTQALLHVDVGLPRSSER